MLIAYEPRIVYRRKGIAEDIRDGGLDGLIFGYTRPYLNDELALSSGNAMGGSANAGSTLKSPTFKSKPGPNKETLLKIEALALNRLEWTIDLPPKPMPMTHQALTGSIGVGNHDVWTAKITKAAALDLCQKIAGSPNAVNADKNWKQGFEAASKLTEWRLCVEALPTGIDFMNHTLWHEMQHVADHRWLADNIIVPLQVWHGALYGNNISFATDRPADAMAELCCGRKRKAGEKYALSAERVTAYWEQWLDKSGKHFHKTAAGAYPVVGLRGVYPQTGTLHLSFHPLQQINQPIFFADAPHAFPVLEKHEIQGGSGMNQWETHDINGVRTLTWLTDASNKNKTVDFLRRADDDDDAPLNLDF